MIRVPEIITPSAGDTAFPGPSRLENGIPVWLLPNGTVDLLRIEFVLPAGQIMEDVHLSATTTSAMLTEGTLDHDAETLNNLIDSTGAVITTTAGRETSGAVAVTLTRNLEEVMALTYELLFRPSFPEKEFRMLTEKRIQAFLTSRQRTSIIARELFWQALCGDANPYGRISALGDFSALTTADLKLFHHARYLAETMYITVAGKEPGRAMPVLEEFFGDAGPWRRERPGMMQFNPAPPGMITGEVPGSVQSTVRMGWRGITHGHPDYHGVTVAATILGGYFGSRLMRRIREEKGYTYGIHAMAGAFSHIGYIAVTTDVANEYRDETVNEIRSEIRKLCRQELGDEEMTLVRNHLLGETARLFDGPFVMADTIRTITDYDTGTDYYSSFAETVRTITPSRIRELFTLYFDPDNAWVIIAGAQ